MNEKKMGRPNKTNGRKITLYLPVQVIGWLRDSGNMSGKIAELVREEWRREEDERVTRREQERQDLELLPAVDEVELVGADKRIHWASEYYYKSQGGYLVDLGEQGDIKHPGRMWAFMTLPRALRFLELFDGGMDPVQAAREVDKAYPPYAE